MDGCRLQLGLKIDVIQERALAFHGLRVWPLLPVVNESLSFWGSMVWNRLPDICKAAKSCGEFKMKIRSWKGSGCNCRMYAGLNRVEHNSSM